MDGDLPMGVYEARSDPLILTINEFNTGPLFNVFRDTSDHVAFHQDIRLEDTNAFCVVETSRNSSSLEQVLRHDKEENVERFWGSGERRDESALKI